jgi:hypothetical protein
VEEGVRGVAGQLHLHILQRARKTTFIPHVYQYIFVKHPYFSEYIISKNLDSYFHPS